jgi:hypothetical protein
MAQGRKEHRMVFDIRGRRRYVVKVVYAILAILMAASLFLVTGAININSILGTGSSGETATSSFEKQAENIEAKLVKTPEDEQLLANLTRTRINVANTMITNGAGKSEAELVQEVKQELALVSEDWSRYQAAAAKPNGILASQAANSLYQLAGLSSGSKEAAENLKAAGEAQQIATEIQPSLHNWSFLTTLNLYNQEFKAAETAKQEATKQMTSKFERESFENEFEATEKRAKEFGKTLEAEEAAAQSSKSGGKESLENPLNGLGGATLGAE